MSIIWILEKSTTSASSLASALIGDFAVRAFASFDSLVMLQRLSRNPRPDLLIIDLTSAGRGEAEIRAFLEAYFADTPALFLAAGSVDSLHLSAHVNGVLRHGNAGGRRNVVQYRDVMLDFDRLQCLVAPGDEPISLPLKEARLLRLLMERPGVCLSRDEIRESIWEDVKVTPRTIDSHVSRLRGRLGEAEVSIESVYGGGYVLK